jgi:prolipoprotein diacylglyceryl transferase
MCSFPLGKSAYGVIFWDPSPEMFPWPLPILGRPLLWYGFFFALGFFLAYLLFLRAVRRAKICADPRKTVDAILTYAILGVVVGARLGDVLFYGRWDSYLRDPLSILRVWEGGLASHGGVLGVLIALFLYCRFHRKSEPKMTFLRLLDLVLVPAGVLAGCIRIGNFVNQEILGTPTDLPWGVVFGHPMPPLSMVARHPVQIYEALVYFSLALLFAILSKKWRARRDGQLTGLFLVLLFSFRIFVEFFKEELSPLLQGVSSPVDMGQILSVPLIALGGYLLWRK